MCTTLLEDVLKNAKTRIKIQDRIIIILSILLLLFVTLSTYFGYHLYKNNDPNEETEDVNEITMLELGEEYEKNAVKPFKKKRVVKFIV